MQHLDCYDCLTTAPFNSIVPRHYTTQILRTAQRGNAQVIHHKTIATPVSDVLASLRQRTSQQGPSDINTS